MAKIDTTQTDAAADKGKGKVVAASMSADLHAALEELRWTERKTMSQLVTGILRESLVARGLLTPEA